MQKLRCCKKSLKNMLIMMKNEQCKNCPLIEEIKLLRAEIKILREKLDKYEKPEKNSGNSSLPHLRIKTKNIILRVKNQVKNQAVSPVIKVIPKYFMKIPMKLLKFIPKNVHAAEITILSKKKIFLNKDKLLIFLKLNLM